MKYGLAVFGALAALPAAAHEGGHLPVHMHPHGTELLLALTVAIAVGVGLYLKRR
jgi:hypothetical protein